MDRKKLDDLAASNFATHVITRSDINDVRRLLEAAETRARQAESRAADYAQQKYSDAVTDVRGNRARAQVLLDTLDTLDETIDSDGLVSEVITRDDLRALTASLDADDIGHTSIERTITVPPRGAVLTATYNLRAEAAGLVTTARAAEDILETEGVFRVTRDTLRMLTDKLDRAPDGLRHVDVPIGPNVVVAIRAFAREAEAIAASAEAVAEVARADTIVTQKVTRADVSADVAALDAADTQHVVVERRAKTQTNGTVVAIAREARDLALDLVDTLNA